MTDSHTNSINCFRESLKSEQIKQPTLWKLEKKKCTILISSVTNSEINTSFSIQQEHQRLARCHYITRDSNSGKRKSQGNIIIISLCDLKLSTIRDYCLQSSDVVSTYGCENERKYEFVSSNVFWFMLQSIFFSSLNIVNQFRKPFWIE
jgi:hypothetical protein